MTAVERDDLVVSMLPRVRYVANRFRERLPSHVDADDLYGAGVLGLIDAAGKYDGRESGFKAFANLPHSFKGLVDLAFVVVGSFSSWHSSRQLRSQGKYTISDLVRL